MYALALQREGKVDEATGALEDALQRDAANCDARLALIGMYREQDKPDLARLHLNPLQQRYPDDSAVQELWQEINP